MTTFQIPVIAKALAETSDENPERVAFVCESMLACIRSAMDSNDQSWEQLQKDFENDPNAKHALTTNNTEIKSVALQNEKVPL